MIICPGGAYERCSDREAEPAAVQFLAMGSHCFILDYSIKDAPFLRRCCSWQRRVAYLRTHAQEMELDEDQITVCGFSAGGHLAASLGVFWNREEVYKEAGAECGEDIRPDRLILSYPVITSGPYGHQGSFRNLLGSSYERNI